MFGKNKLVPKITTDDYVLSYEVKDKAWSFVYKNVSFYIPSHEIELPKVNDLNTYLNWVELKKEHINICVSTMFAGWGEEINLSAAHIAQIEIEKINCISVMILGDSTWGDMGYDLWFKDGEIINEGAGD